MESSGFVSGIFLFVGFAFIGYALLGLSCRDPREGNKQALLFIVAFALRFALSLLIYQFGLIEVIKDEDGGGWVIGQSIQQNWINSEYTVLDLPRLWLESYNGNNRGYWNMLGMYFFITDQPSRMSAAVLNNFCGAWTVILVYRIGDTLFGKEVANRAAWLTCLFPSMIVWSAQTIKEPIVIFLETVVLYGCVRMRKAGFSPGYLALTLGTCAVIFPFRFYAAYIAAVCVGITVLLPRFRSKGNTAFLLWMISLPLVFATVWFLQKESNVEKYNLEMIESVKEYAGKTEGSGVDIDYDLQSPTGFAIAVAIGAAYLLFSPFPWEMAGGSLRMLLVGPEVIAWWVIFGYAVIPGLGYCLKRRFVDVLPLLVFLIGLGLLYSITFSNVGLAYRQRAQLLPYLFIFAGVGFEYRKAMAARKRRKPEPKAPTTRRAVATSAT